MEKPCKICGKPLTIESGYTHNGKSFYTYCKKCHSKYKSIESTIEPHINYIKYKEWTKLYKTCHDCGSIFERKSMYKNICKPCRNARLREERSQKTETHIKLLEYRRNYRVKYLSNESNRILQAIRTRSYQAIKRGSKYTSTVRLIGCTIDFLKSYLESQFTEGMTWDNYGEWHIDHIRPCASFDLTDPEQQKQCFHYTNLQPLWAIDNMKKCAKWEG